jgi:hypothetical protein
MLSSPRGINAEIFLNIFYSFWYLLQSRMITKQHLNLVKLDVFKSNLEAVINLLGASAQISFLCSVFLLGSTQLKRATTKAATQPC